MNHVYLGLGANLDAPIEQLNLALQALNSVTEIELVTASRFYSSKPMGPQDQPDYVNAVALIQTQLEPHALLDTLQNIEREQGRVRKDERWGARTLDLDILLYNDEQINCERLTVPHYGLCDREFVVYPLLEIAPDLILPNGAHLKDICRQVSLNGLTAL